MKSHVYNYVQNKNFGWLSFVENVINLIYVSYQKSGRFYAECAHLVCFDFAVAL